MPRFLDDSHTALCHNYVEQTGHQVLCQPGSTMGTIQVTITQRQQQRTQKLNHSQLMQQLHQHLPHARKRNSQLLTAQNACRVVVDDAWTVECIAARTEELELASRGLHSRLSDKDYKPQCHQPPIDRSAANLVSRPSSRTASLSPANKGTIYKGTLPPKRPEPELLGCIVLTPCMLRTSHPVCRVEQNGSVITRTSSLVASQQQSLQEPHKHSLNQQEPG